MTLAIRPYAAADLERMMEIWRAATRSAHPFLTADNLDRDEALIRTEFIHRTESRTAWQDDKLVGFMSLMDRLIVALFVDPARHRSGIGSRLIADAVRRHGPLAVEVFGENAGGVAFYRKNGFEFMREQANPLYSGRPHWLMAQKGAPIAGRTERDQADSARWR